MRATSAARRDFSSFLSFGIVVAVPVVVAKAPK